METKTELLEMTHEQLIEALATAHTKVNVLEVLEAAHKEDEEKLKRRNLQLQTAIDVSRAAASMLDIDELIQQSVELIRDSFDLYYVGLFLVDNPQTYRYWSPRMVGQLVKEQRKLMQNAFRALKPGGTLVYSTCTLIREENEANVAWLLGRFGEELSLEKPDFTLIGAENLQRISNLDHTGGNMLTIIPSPWYEGFFVAKFRKKTVAPERVKP